MKKNPNRKTVSRLEDLPNIGKAMAADLRLLGIHHPQDLIGKDPFALHGRLSEIAGTVQDPCVVDVFMSAIRFMEGAEPLPWWSYTAERKHIIQENRRKKK